MAFHLLEIRLIKRMAALDSILWDAALNNFLRLIHRHLTIERVII